jgi:hypothetical protein
MAATPIPPVSSGRPFIRRGLSALSVLTTLSVALCAAPAFAGHGPLQQASPVAAARQG